MKFDLTGTVMMNRRGLPIEVKQKKLKVGEVIAIHNDYESVLAWKDKREFICSAQSMMIQSQIPEEEPARKYQNQLLSWNIQSTWVEWI